MKFIQTLYVDKDVYKHGFGWAKPEYHLMSWALSCLQLKAIYDDVYLHCNDDAAELLIRDLNLPYSDSYTTHENFSLPDESLWALPKIYTYSLQHEPFVHVDGDVFLFKKLPQSLLDSELIAQNREEATEYYLSAQRDMMKCFTYFPGCVKEDFESTIPIKAVNAGIIGGNNMEFIHEYSALALEYVNRNIENYSSVSIQRFNVFFEQHLFYSLASSKKIPIGYLFPDMVLDNQYTGFSDFHEVPFKKSYCHLLGQYKKDEHTCLQMAAKLKQLFPEHYYHIIALCRKKNISLHTNIYDALPLHTVNDYAQFNLEATAKYRDSYDVTIIDDDDSMPDIESGSNCLKELVNGSVEWDKEGDNMELQSDFEIFSENLGDCIHASRSFSVDYLYGRDTVSIDWYAELFANESELEEKTISRCCEVKIIPSHFDWAGIVNKNKRIGVRYYNELKLEPGSFYNLFVPEVFDVGFSLYDLDEIESILLDHLSRPCTVNELYTQMHQYVDDEVLQNNLTEYHNLLTASIKQLVLKKAIKPYKKSFSIN